MLWRGRSDITCSFPANGRFTDAQRAVYESVLAAHQACQLWHPFALYGSFSFAFLFTTADTVTHTNKFQLPYKLGF